MGKKLANGPCRDGKKWEFGQLSGFRKGVSRMVSPRFFSLSENETGKKTKENGRKRKKTERNGQKQKKTERNGTNEENGRKRKKIRKKKEKIEKKRKRHRSDDPFWDPEFVTIFPMSPATFQASGHFPCSFAPSQHFRTGPLSLVLLMATSIARHSSLPAWRAFRTPTEQPTP